MKKYFLPLKIITGLFLTGLFFFGDLVLYILTYIAVFVFVSMRTLMIRGKKRVRFYLILCFSAVTALQIVAAVLVVFGEGDDYLGVEGVLRRIFGILIIFLPLVVSRFTSEGRYARFYLPSIHEAATISFSQLKGGVETVSRILNQINEKGKDVTADHVREIAANLQRNDSFRYINEGSLTAEYFSLARDTLSDTGLYIVISNTGSAASQVISVFTQTQFNHASISFDIDLKTIISYNGGDRIYPPGLNQEMLEYFNRRQDASILVYRLPCTEQQKRKILDKIEEINNEGSAYNTMGLILKYSHKPNIMFCSQFVYRMLEHADLTYFSKPAATVRPTDLIELDYYKKLSFCYELKLNIQQDSPEPHAP